MKEFALVGGLGIVWIAVYLAILYVIIFYLLIPAISIVAKMFGYPGLV